MQASMKTTAIAREWNASGVALQTCRFLVESASVEITQSRPQGQSLKIDFRILRTGGGVG